MKKYLITNVDLLNNDLQEACFSIPLNTKNLKALHVQFRHIRWCESILQANKYLCVCNVQHYAHGHAVVLVIAITQSIKQSAGLFIPQEAGYLCLTEQTFFVPRQKII